MVNAPTLPIRTLQQTSRPSVRSVQRRLSSSTDVVRSRFRSLKMVRQNQLRSLLTSSLVLTSVDLIRLRNAKKNNQPRNNNGQQGGRPQRDNRRNQRDGQDNYRQPNDNRRPQNDNRRPQNGYRRPYNGPRPAQQQNKVLHSTIEMKADSLSKRKENKNET